MKRANRKIYQKRKQTLYGLRMIKKYFNPFGMKLLLDSYFYPVLYYNSEIWLTQNVNNSLLQSLFSISANAFRSCLSNGKIWKSTKMVKNQLSYIPLSNLDKRSFNNKMVFWRFSMIDIRTDKSGCPVPVPARHILSKDILRFFGEISFFSVNFAQSFHFQPLGDTVAYQSLPKF